VLGLTQPALLRQGFGGQPSILGSLSYTFGVSQPKL